MKILLAASENDGLPGAKVGGIGDVVRDVPPELAVLGHQAAIVVPSYGFLNHLPGSQERGTVAFRFGKHEQTARLWAVPGRKPRPGVTHYVIDHPGLDFFDRERNQHRLYVNDPPFAPFATDATKYALFCAAVAQAIQDGLFGPLDVLHLHDWHAAFLLILRRFRGGLEALPSIPCAFTIHNLSLQGTRPLRGHESSLEAWYPDLVYDPAFLADPRWPDCVNPMVAGIRMADAVHAVSPSYAQEILSPGHPPASFGGEGLEGDLQKASGEGRLHGILNGCEYPPSPRPPAPAFPDLVAMMKEQVLRWALRQRIVPTAHFWAHVRLAALGPSPQRPRLIFTFVGRIFDQKMLLLKKKGNGGACGLQGILDALHGHGLFVLLGSGDPEYEEFLAEAAGQYPHFIFLNGFSNELAAALYAAGDLFLMPSSFEPCGISQMLAMREGQPCLAHAVGGLKDTVRDGHNGFLFGGETVEEQVDGLIAACRRAVDLYLERPQVWADLRRGAAASRFSWSDSVRAYERHLYGPGKSGAAGPRSDLNGHWT